jgi:hypothetical protein
MTKDDYNKAGILLEQIEKTKLLQRKIQSKYDEYKETDAELCQVLNSCNEALDVLKDIDTKKFQQL